jgi:hypothetical protein
MPGAKEKSGDRPRKDGRKPLLVYMDAALIKVLKKAALDDECNAYEIVENATRSWLEDRGKKKQAK